MQASDDKSWERFIDKAMQEARPDEISSDFTEKVLVALENKEQASLATRYKAPISRLTWFVLGVVLAGVMIWSAIAGTSTQWDWASKLSTYMNVSDLFEGIALPSLESGALYSIGFFALFVLLQVALMKRFFDRRLGLQ
ncbi:MAG: hypothetical protein R3356_08575 [Eudoraea sp.]|nr:hypothetical protein [Eudoraea sp.]